MKKLLSLLACVVLFGLFAANAFADIPPQQPVTKKSKEMSSQMRIETRSDISEARLIIPRGMSKQMRAELEGEDDPAIAATGGFSNLSPTQTVIGGLLLSVAFVFGGVWFVRSAKESGKTARAAGIFAFLAATGIVATISFANSPPPNIMRAIDSEILSERAQRYGVRGKLKIEISDSENQIVLLLPQKSNGSANE